MFVYRNECKYNYGLRINLIQDESGNVFKFNDAVSHDGKMTSVVLNVDLRGVSEFILSLIFTF